MSTPVVAAPTSTLMIAVPLPTIPVFEPEDYVLVEFLMEEVDKKRHYIGKIITAINMDVYEISYLRHKETYFVYSNVADVYDTSWTRILRKLDSVRPLGRNRFQFPNKYSSRIAFLNYILSEGL